VVTWHILCLLGIFCGYLAYFVVIWYIFHVLVLKIWQPCPKSVSPEFVISRFSTGSGDRLKQNAASSGDQQVQVQVQYPVTDAKEEEASDGKTVKTF
jgi:hypothetical protein